MDTPGTCYGCDDGSEQGSVAFSGKQVDRCGVCDGDGRYAWPVRNRLKAPPPESEPAAVRPRVSRIEDRPLGLDAREHLVLRWLLECRRSCVSSLNCIVTPCQFLQRPNYRFPADIRQLYWDRCEVYDECGLCGGDGTTCLPELEKVSNENAGDWWVEHDANCLTDLQLIRLQLRNVQLRWGASGGGRKVGTRVGKGKECN